MLYFCPPVFYWPRLFSSFLHKGKASAAAVTLGNISLPVQVAHIRPPQLQVPCTPINPRWEKGSQCNAILWCFLHVWQMSLFYLYYLLCFFRSTHLSNSRKFFGWEKKEERQWGLGFLWMSKVGMEGTHDRWQISVRWCSCGPLWDIWMYVWLPRTLRSFHDLYCMSSSSYWVVLQEKNVCHQPLNMCLNDISPVCLWECLTNACLCRRIEILKHKKGKKKLIRLEVQKNVCLRVKLQRDESWWATIDSPSHRVLMTFCALISWS